MISEATVRRLAPDMLIVEDRHGALDFHRICLEHRWASAGSVYRGGLPRCPFCAVRADEVEGHHRFDEFQRLLTADAPPPAVVGSGKALTGEAEIPF